MYCKMFTFGIDNRIPSRVFYRGWRVNEWIPYLFAALAVSIKLKNFQRYGCCLFLRVNNLYFVLHRLQKDFPKSEEAHNAIAKRPIEDLKSARKNGTTVSGKLFFLCGLHFLVDPNGAFSFLSFSYNITKRP